MGGKNFDIPIELRTWGAKCISGLGSISDTVESRCLRLRLKKKFPSEKVLRRNAVLADDPNTFIDLRQRIVRFTIDFEDEIRSIKVPLLEELDDRLQDIWSGLFKIAKFIDEEVYEEAVQAAKSLSPADQTEKSEGIELLEDIHHLFDDGMPDRVTSKVLSQRLCSLEDRPWATYQRLGLNQYQLATLLKSFGIRTKQIKTDGKNIRHYERQMFEEVFSRYLSK